MHPATEHPLRARLESLLRAGELELPTPGAGRTPERHRALYEIARKSLALARLAEGHVDATAILAEAGRTPMSGALYGVWASEAAQAPLRLERDADGWELSGAKHFCSGATLLDAALVTAHRGGELLLIEVDLRGEEISATCEAWASAALAATATGTVAFSSAPVAERMIVGAPGWYLSRPGFWHGALGPASSWAGGAAGLADRAAKSRRRDPHSRAQLGALAANRWGLEAILERAGREIDADPLDETASAQARALSARHLVERLCTDSLDRFGRATGPHLLALDDEVAHEYAALTLYIRQCHAERDLEALA